MSLSKAERQKDIQNAVKWARGVLSAGDRYVLLDIECEDWDDEESEIEHVAVSTTSGEILLDQELSTVGGDDLPKFKEFWPKVQKLMEKRKFVVFNEQRVVPIINSSEQRNGFSDDFMADCLMEHYSAYKNVYSDSFGDYKWQALPGKQEGNPAKDCKKMAELLRVMQEMPVKKNSSNTPMSPAKRTSKASTTKEMPSVGSMVWSLVLMIFATFFGIVKGILKAIFKYK